MIAAAASLSIASFLEKPPAWVSIGGYLLVTLVAVQLLIGYRRIRMRNVPFRKSHLAVAWALGVVMALHAAMGIAHAVVAYIVRK